MGVSISIVAAVSFLDLLAFVLAIGAESRRSTVGSTYHLFRFPSIRYPTGRVVPDEYDDRTYCSYDSDASTAYGVAAFFVLLASQALLIGVTRCLCCGRGLAAGGSRTCAIAAFILSWVTFVVAEACLVAGSARNAYHTKYVGYYIKRDLTSCAALRKGVFAAAAALVLVSLVASLVYYWSYSRANTGGWVKHQNEGGVGMTDYGTDKGKGEFGGTTMV